MASHVRKKVRNATAPESHESRKKPTSITIEWKVGPYMRPISIGYVTATYWEKKGALMSQEPGAPANLHEEFPLFARDKNAESNMQNTDGPENNR